MLQREGMLQEAIDRVPDVVVGQLAMGVGVFVLVLGVGYSLVFGTNGLMALGLTRQTAGIVVTTMVVVACLYGLYWFATRMVEW